MAGEIADKELIAVAIDKYTDLQQIKKQMETTKMKYLTT